MSAINTHASSANSSTTRTAPKDAYSALTSSDFLKIMFSELTQQDPLQPSSTKDLLDQIGQVRSIQSNLTLTDQLNSVVKQNQISGAGSFIGQVVQGLDGGGAKKTGIVSSVSISNNGVTLNLGSGDQIDLKNLQQVYGYPAPASTGNRQADTGATSTTKN